MDFVELIAKHRTLLMGIAIILVVLYHLTCWTTIRYLRVFTRYGYIGVDIFMFLSGFGLYYSYKKSDLQSFYKKRLLRIYPVFFFLVVMSYLIDGQGIDNIKYLFENLLTIGYWKDFGIHQTDWYLESLFYLYLFYPLFYHISKAGYWGLLFITIPVVLVLFFYQQDIYYWYYCLLARLPIFLLGIVVASGRCNLWVISIISLLLYGVSHYLNLYIDISFAAIPLIVACLIFCKYIPSRMYSIFCDFGRESLYIYGANVLTFYVFRSNYWNGEYLPNIVLILLYFPLLMLFYLLIKYTIGTIGSYKSKFAHAKS